VKTLLWLVLLMGLGLLVFGLSEGPSEIALGILPGALAGIAIALVLKPKLKL